MATRTAANSLVVDGVAIPEGVLRSLLGRVAAGGERGEVLTRLAETLRSCGVDASVSSAPTPTIASGIDEQAGVLLNAIGEGVCLADAHGRELWSNELFRSMPESVKGRAHEAMAQSATVFASRAGGAAPGDRVCKFDLESDDGQAVFELFVTPAPPRSETTGDLGETEADRAAASDRAAAEGAERVAGVIRDVTRARLATAKLDAIDAAGQELIQLDAEAVRGKNTMERLQLLESKIVRLTHDVLDYDHFAIFLIDKTRSRLELVMSAGLPPEIQDLELTAEERGSGISGYVAATGKAYVCRDASADDKYLPGLQGARSSLTIPLWLNDVQIGVMDVESRTPDAFDAESQQFLEIFARHVAMALHMLDLLVVERVTINEAVTGRVGQQISAPLEDIVSEIDWLNDHAGDSDLGAHLAEHVGRIRADVEAIKKRLREVQEGPRTVLGVDKAMRGSDRDPVIGGRRILIADDELGIRKVLGQVLSAKGARVNVCACGQDAIDALSGGDERYDLVISDIRMPDRNGYEVFSAARKASTETRVILITGFGYDPHHSIVRATQKGLHGVIFKPFEMDQMLDEVRKALGSQAESSG